MGMSSLNATCKVSTALVASNNLTPSQASPIANSSSPSKTITVGTSAANNAAGGGDECALFLTSVTASSNTTIDLTSVTDLLNTAAVTLARVKWVVFQLLSATDDATNGNACSSVTLDSSAPNGWTSQSFSGGFGNATSKLDIPNGAVSNLIGVVSAAGVVVDSTHKIIKVINNDGALTAKFQTTLVGGST